MFEKKNLIDWYKVNYVKFLQFMNPFASFEPKKWSCLSNRGLNFPLEVSFDAAESTK